MPVSVRVPIRLRVDPDALTYGSSELDDALSAALVRALRRAHDETAKRPDALAEEFDEPTFSWSGEGLTLVDASTRERLEALVREVAARGPTAIAWRPPSASRVGGVASETADRSRLDAFASLYELPSYN